MFPNIHCLLLTLGCYALACLAQLLSQMLHGFNAIGKNSLPPEVGYPNNLYFSAHCFTSSSSQSTMLSAHHSLGVFPVARSETGDAQKPYIFASERGVAIYIHVLMQTCFQTYIACCLH